MNEAPPPPQHHALSRRRFIGVGAGAATAAALGVTAVPTSVAAAPLEPIGPEVPAGWARTLYDVVMAAGLTPPVAARFYHYTSLTMYEAALPAMSRQRSLSTQLPGLDRLPRPARPIDAQVAMSVAVADVAIALIPNGPAAAHQTIVDYRDRLVAARTRHSTSQLVGFSTWHGLRIAGLLRHWMASDGYAEAAALPYTPPVGPSLWRSTPPNFGTAIDPHWSMVRPSALRTADEVVPAEPIPFDTHPDSDFYRQALAPYQQSKVNTPEQVTIARFWTDNPRLSGLPSGHWFLMLAQISEDEPTITLDKALDGFVRLGIALHDAFLNCWTWKYRYNLIRPVSYVQDHIDASWATVVNTPQFPEYTSGHSVASGAAAVVLTRLFGAFPFTDNTGAPRGFAGRHFDSFDDAAAEAAQSRIYGGIHYPMAIENGLVQGREIGRLVNERIFTRRPL